MIIAYTLYLNIYFFFCNKTIILCYIFYSLCMQSADTIYINKLILKLKCIINYYGGLIFIRYIIRLFVSNTYQIKFNL